MAASSLPANSLALALSGFSVDAETELSAGKPPAAAPAPSRQREVAAGTAALVDHANAIAGRVLERWQLPGYEAEQDSDQLASLCFALQSTIGTRGRLGEEDERVLFELASALWGASLLALSGGDCGGASRCTAGPAAGIAAALDRMGNELFALLDGDSDSTQECARYVAFFSKAAASWKAAGQGERARWCLEKAMRYSQQLEAQIASEEVTLDRKQGFVVALFNLYLEGAKSAADNKQQALANNLLSRAVQLSRHAAVRPDAAACCTIAVAELQLQQAKHMLEKGGAMCGLAVALLSSSYQQLTSSDLQVAAASGSAHHAGLLGFKKQVLTMLCKAHLATGDASLASKVLDALDTEAPGAAAADPDLQLVFVEVKVLAGRVPEALRFLMELMKHADLAVPPGKQATTTFLAGLRLALRHITDETLPSFQSAVSSFVWKATAAAPAALLSLVQALLAQDQGSALCHRLALQTLSSDDVSAALHSQADLLTQVHSVLWHRAAHCFEAGSWDAAKELFSAAFQFSKAETRSKNARALAACHSRLGMHQRAAEWLDIAARHEQQQSSLTQLVRLQELVHTGDAAQAVATTRSLASSCTDFHPSLIASMCQAAAKAQHPAVYKEALSTAVQMLIKADAAGSSMAIGQEAALLLGHVQAIDACLQAGLVGGAADVAAATANAGGNAPLYAELVAAVKLSAKRLKLLGWDKFVGAADSKANPVEAICGLAYNQLLVAQQCSVHEHVVALATGLWQLLPLADQRLRSDITGAAQQAKILLLATQALLDLHSKQPDSTKNLALAAKLQAKVAHHISSLPVEQHAQLHLLHHSLCLETAARQNDGAALLQCIVNLQPHAARLSAPQRVSMLGVTGSQHSGVVREAACGLLMESIGADGSLEAVLLVPAVLNQLSLPGERQLEAVRRCHQLLAAAAPPPHQTASWIQCSQWLAVFAWNTGSRLAQPTGDKEQAVAFMGVAVQLQEACVAAGSNFGGSQLRRMQAALAAMSGQANGAAAGQEPAGQTAEAAIEDGAAETQAEIPSAEPAASSAAVAALLLADAAAAAAGSGCSSKQTASKPHALRPAAPCSRSIASRPLAAGGTGSLTAGAAQQPVVLAGECCPPHGLPAAACSGSSARPAGSHPPLPGASMSVAEVVPPAEQCGEAQHQLLACEAPLGRAAARPITAAAITENARKPQQQGMASAPAPPAAAAADPDAELAAEAAEDSLSDSEWEGPAGHNGWLDAVLAAQKRVLGGVDGGQAAKKRGVQGSHGGVTAAAGTPAGRGLLQASAWEADKQQQQQQHRKPAPPVEDDNADALSLCDSMPGALGFMGL